MMKVLYVVNACDGKYVDFHAVQVIGENENEFEILDRMNVENYVHNFPKDKINIELKLAYVTDKLDKKTLKVQIDRVYNKLREKYMESNENQLKKTNEDYYKSSIDLLKRCITPEEYEAKGLAKKEKKELIDKFKVFFD